MQLKTCNRCGAVKELTEFHADANTKDKHSRRCKVCACAAALDYRNRNLERQRENSRRWSAANKDRENSHQKQWYRKNAHKVRTRYIKQTYGLTPEQWEAMFEKQGRKCAICGTPHPGNGPFNAWATDHCHKSTEVRGILCPKCNKGIGLLNDCPINLLASISYLSVGTIS